MNRKYFMLDIETTGTEPSEGEVLAIAILAVKKEGQYWVPGDFLDLTLGSRASPVTAFAKTHQRLLYARCNATAPRAVADVRREMLNHREK